MSSEYEIDQISLSKKQIQLNKKPSNLKPLRSNKNEEIITEK